MMIKAMKKQRKETAWQQSREKHFTVVFTTVVVIRKQGKSEKIHLKTRMEEGRREEKRQSLVLCLIPLTTIILLTSADVLQRWPLNLKMYGLIVMNITKEVVWMINITKHIGSVPPSVYSLFMSTTMDQVSDWAGSLDRKNVTLQPYSLRSPSSRSWTRILTFDLRVSCSSM